MTADLAENLLPTIVSRCEVLRLSSAGWKELSAALVKNDVASPAQARLLAHITVVELAMQSIFCANLNL